MTAPGWSMQGNTYDIEPVDRSDLTRHLARRARHSRQPDVAPKQALIGQPGKRFTPVRRIASLLHFDELVQATFPRAIGHDSPGGFVHDLHLAISDNVVLIAPEQDQRSKCLLHQLFAGTNGRPYAGKIGRELL